jgi:hypothetical protein
MPVHAKLDSLWRNQHNFRRLRCAAFDKRHPGGGPIQLLGLKRDLTKADQRKAGLSREFDHPRITLSIPQ